MSLAKILQTKQMSVLQCSKESNIPYTTLLDLVREKTRLQKSTAETVYKLAKALNMTVEELLENVMKSTDYRCEFEIFKSNVCHQVKEKGDLDFIIQTLDKDEIRAFWEKEWIPECFYLLAMVDYLSRLNELPLCQNYADIRRYSLPEPLYPKDIRMAAILSPKLDIREESKKEAIPEFLRFNIIESEVRNVC